MRAQLGVYRNVKVCLSDTMMSLDSVWNLDSLYGLREVPEASARNLLECLDFHITQDGLTYEKLEQ